MLRKDGATALILLSVYSLLTQKQNRPPLQRSSRFSDEPTIYRRKLSRGAQSMQLPRTINQESRQQRHRAASGTFGGTGFPGSTSDVQMGPGVFFGVTFEEAGGGD